VVFSPVIDKRAWRAYNLAIHRACEWGGAALHKVTINDIAKELGIANSTVSRALRDEPTISAPVKREVKRAAALMGYVPNIAARSLRTGRSRIIGLLVRDIRDGLSPEVIPGVEAACAAREYGLLVCNAGDDPMQERSYLHMLHQRRVDGILILTPKSQSPETYLTITRGTPMVLVDAMPEDAPICAVSVDHVTGLYLSTRHLLDLGHRRIVFLCGPLSLSPCANSARGYARAMLEAGIAEADHRVVATEQTGIAAGYDAMLRIMKLVPRPTALAVVSDLMAAGALEAARCHGMSVPHDLSIVGYDDIPLGALLSPPLTTVNQDKDRLARAAVDLLLDEIQSSEHTHRQVLLRPTLVVRGSTAPAPYATEP
jgi:LacI family transcriptional regulator